MRVTLLMITLVLLAAVAFAAVPQQISYQGRLTSATNTPITGAKNLTFKIYSGAGAVLWNSGPVSVTCTDGLFSVNLGASPQPALPVTVFSDTAATLGVTVESDPELTPRIRLTSAPFSFSTLKASDYLPLTGGTLSGPVTWDFPFGNKVFISGSSGLAEIQAENASGSYGLLRPGNLNLSDPFTNSYAGIIADSAIGGYIILQNKVANQSVRLGAFSNGGTLQLLDSTANAWAYLKAQNEEGGALKLGNVEGDTTVKLINYYGGSGLRMSSKRNSERAVLMADSTQGGYLALFGPTGNLMDVIKPAVGDLNTTLPDSAISAREILDEPGPAFYFGNGSVTLTTTMQDLATVTITIPTSGYILLSGKVGEIDLAGTTGENWANVQIDETAGGTTNNYYAAAVGGGSFPDVIWHAFTASTQRAYFKSAGTYTFRLEALRGPSSNPAGTAKAFYPTLTAVFYPTSYGTTTAPVAANEAGQFERVTPVSSTETSGTGLSSIGMYEVDLRELELKAAKARAEAEKAERELLQAQLKQQTNR